MHFNVEQILWALVLAAHLVLLIVLLGRDRTARFPWFTAAIAISAVRLIADHLLHGKLTAIAFYWQTYSLGLAASIIGLLVLAELARRVFSSGRAGLILKPKGWIGWGLVMFVSAVLVLWQWGPWPSWKALNAEPALLPLRLVWLTDLKFEIFLGVLTIETMLLLFLFGRRFGFPGTSHPQQIALGLSTSVIAQFTVQATSTSIQKSVHLTSQDQYDHIVKLLTNLDNGRFALWFLVIVWWTFWMWRDDPTWAAPSTPDDQLELQPVDPLSGHDLEPAPALEAHLPDDPAGTPRDSEA
jgi:hypothetical protein